MRQFTVFSKLAWIRLQLNVVLLCSNSARAKAGALRLVQAWLQLAPSDSTAHLYHGCLLRQAGNLRAAVAAFIRSAELSNQPDSAWFNAGFTLEELGESAAALRYFERAVQANPLQDRAWLGRGQCLVQLGRLQEACAAFQKTTELQPFATLAWQLWARTEITRGQADAAKQVIDQLARFDPRAAHALRTEFGASSLVRFLEPERQVQCS